MTTTADQRHDRIVKFYTELSTIVQQAQQGKQALIQGATQRELATKDADTNAQKQIDAQIVHLKRVTEVAEKAAIEKSKRSSLHQAKDLLDKIQARLENHGELLKALSTMEAQFELAVAMGEFDEGKGGMTRADAEQQLAIVRTRVEKALELAHDQVPSPGIVLL